LVQPDGVRLTRETLAGRVWLLGFVDTTCVACSERLGSALERLQYRIRNVGPGVGILEVGLPAEQPAVDLATDTLRRHANPRLWRTASGPEARRLLGEVGAVAPWRAPMLEAGRALVLVDAHGRVRAIESIEVADSVDRLVSKLTLVLNTR
jgi:hypothetical protein